jgi:hypothetical protein
MAYVFIVVLRRKGWARNIGEFKERDKGTKWIKERKKSDKG